ncbi:MAG: UDP-N-acetylmuramoyl-L-alanyl-D-glutamate--2,6-diaminopimelate ligase [Thermomicrobiaceae bacterium]
MKPEGKTAGELLDAAGAKLVTGDPEVAVTSIHYDSRQVEPGGLFIALRGGYADGHAFLTDALERGAVAALVEDSSEASAFLACGVVENTRAALSPLSARYFDNPGDHLGVIGVTGTDGKTTTTYLIDAILRSNGLRTGLVGTVSIRIGDSVVDHDTRQTTPESLEVQRLLAEMRSESVNWAVLEATSHALALYRLDDCPFDIAVITNVTREHLDFHGSVDAYRQAKAQLIRRVEKGTGRPYPRGVVANLDDEGSRTIAESSTIPVHWFSVEDSTADLFASDVQVHAEGTRFKLTSGAGSVEINLKLIGGYNVFNAMAAAGAGLITGLDLDAIRDGLESLPYVPGRMQRIECGQPFSVIVDYAHSPASLEATLNLVRSVTSGRVIVVGGSAGERDRGKRQLQGRVSAELADLAIFTSEDPRFEAPDVIIAEIAEGAESTGAVSGRDFLTIESRQEAIRTAVELAEPGDSILLAGKGHETCMIYEDKRIPWNEASEAKQALKSRGFSAVNPEMEGSA